MFDTPGQGFGRKDMPHRHEDWFRQAQRDLEQARLSIEIVAFVQAHLPREEK